MVVRLDVSNGPYWVRVVRLRLHYLNDMNIDTSHDATRTAVILAYRYMQKTAHDEAGAPVLRRLRQVLLEMRATRYQAMAAMKGN